MNFSSSEYYSRQECPKQCDLGELSVFICSILLSFGGFISIIASSIRRSRCKNITCCGLFNCDRELVVDGDPAI
jgi:hypothetical protein